MSGSAREDDGEALQRLLAPLRANPDEAAILTDVDGTIAPIVVIATLAVTLQAIYGNVDVPNAALVGIPAIGGAIAGTALQQRIPERLISLLFAALLVVIAIELIVP